MSDPYRAPDESRPARDADSSSPEETIVVAQHADGSVDVVEFFSDAGGPAPAQGAEPAAAAASEPAASAPEPAAEVVPPLYGVGPVTVRELALGGVWLLAFLFSFFAITPGPFASVWSSGLLWILTIGVPTAAVFLVLLRRFSPQGIRRVGSLGIDQFASVAFSVSAVLWVQMVWDTVAFAAATGIWARTWVMWVELVLMLAGVVLTVLAPVIPVLRDDFLGRPEQGAHPNARAVRAVQPRPVAPRPAAHPAPATHRYPAPAGYAAPATATIPVYDRDPGFAPEPGYEPQGAYRGETAYTGEHPYATADQPSATGQQAYATGEHQGSHADAPATEPVRYEAFWVLAPEERDVLDEYGAPLFRIGPTAWALVIEDRGSVYVMRHEDGRVGYLHDVTGVVRG